MTNKRLSEYGVDELASLVELLVLGEAKAQVLVAASSETYWIPSSGSEFGEVAARLLEFEAQSRSIDTATQLDALRDALFEARQKMELDDFLTTYKVAPGRFELANTQALVECIEHYKERSRLNQARFCPQVLVPQLRVLCYMFQRVGSSGISSIFESTPGNSEYDLRHVTVPFDRINILELQKRTPKSGEGPLKYVVRSFHEQTNHKGSLAQFVRFMEKNFRASFELDASERWNYMNWEHPVGNPLGHTRRSIQNRLSEERGKSK